MIIIFIIIFRAVALGLHCRIYAGTAGMQLLAIDHVTVCVIKDNVPNQHFVLVWDWQACMTGKFEIII